MPLSHLGARLDLERQGVKELERREAEDRITLRALRHAADALDCDLVYALIPRRSLAQMLKREAHAIATREIQPVAHSMRLENQAVPAQEIDRQIRDRAAEILRAWPKGFWKNYEQ
jgi:predicted DNA-binding mobile mystery protein A